MKGTGKRGGRGESESGRHGNRDALLTGPSQPGCLSTFPLNS